MDTSDASRRFLARLLLRSRLSDAEQAAILALPGRERRVAAHRDIVRPGQKMDHACLVANGLAGRFDQLANGQRQITALHIPGDMCDLHSVVVPRAGWGIEALSDSVVVDVPHAALAGLAAEHPRIAFAFWRDTVADASILAKWISALGRRGAKARLAHLLCEMGLRMEQAALGERDRYRLDTTQAQLADVLGITPVHLNRVFQTLRAAGQVSTRGAEILIPDNSALRRMAEFDPQYLLLERFEP